MFNINRNNNHNNNHYNYYSDRSWGYHSHDFDDEPIDDDQKITNANVDPYGIRNLGATCFMNSALQSLLSLTSFISKLDELIETADDSTLLKAFKRFIFSHDPSKVKNLVARKNKDYYTFTQQDSFEFALTFIDSISDENKKGIDGLFIGESDSIIQCNHCNDKTCLKQVYSMFSLSTCDTRRVTYIPFSLTKSIISMSHIPNPGDIITTKDYYSKDKFQIKEFALMTKLRYEYQFIDKISPEYPYIYLFELPDEIQNGYGLTIIQLKTVNKKMVTLQFLCEVPLNREITENEMKDILSKRLTKVTRGKKEELFQCLRFKKSSFNFTFSEKPPICKEHLSVTVTDDYIFSFSRRSNVSEKRSISLEELFNCHIRQYQLEPGFTFPCDHCGEKTRVYKRTKYTSLPKVLLFQVKRSTGDARQTMPDDAEVLFPFRLSIDTSGEFDKICVDPPAESKEVVYELKSISHHSGSFGGGHYWAYVNRSGSWYCCNDSSVRRISDPISPSKTAYWAFYEVLPGQSSSVEKTAKEEEDKEKAVSQEQGNGFEHENSNNNNDDDDDDDDDKTVNQEQGNGFKHENNSKNDHDDDDDDKTVNQEQGNGVCEHECNHDDDDGDGCVQAGGEASDGPLEMHKKEVQRTRSHNGADGGEGKEKLGKKGAHRTRSHNDNDNGNDADDGGAHVNVDGRRKDGDKHGKKDKHRHHSRHDDESH